MAHLILKEIEQDPFNVDQLVENLTYKSTDGRVGSSSFDPLILEDIFKRTIEDLKKLNEKSKVKLDGLGNECTKEKEACRERIINLERNYKDSYDHLSSLEKRISYVSTTMAEMGNQLENLNRPRLNLYESHKTAKYFDKFMDGIENSGVFADDSKLDQAAEVIYKLHLVVQDMKDEKFVDACVLIDNKYIEIENKLIQMFHQAYFTGDRKEMKKYLNILSNFKSYQECINEFIKNLQSPLLSSKEMFTDILPLCKDANDIINEVLPNNERIMEQFIRDLFLGKVQNYVNSNIEKYKDVDSEKYLDTIFLYYNKNKKIFKQIATILKISSESSFFSKLINDVYSIHLKDYVHLEKYNLQNKLKLHLDRFYESIGHVKKQLQTGFVSNLLSKQTNELIDERFLSHDVTTLCIDDAKKAIHRTLVLCETSFQPKVIEEIYDIICYFLCKEHFYYSIDLNINALLSIDFKQDLNLAIFPLIKQQNDLMYLFETFSQGTVFTALSSTASQTKLKNKLKQICTELETKIDNALEKSFTVICNHIKNVIQIEQKKIDFKPETDEVTNKCTPACAKAIKIIENQIGKINSCLDGRNINSALKELGIKFHRCIYDHLFRFEYNEIGAMALIRDINEYRLCAKNFNSPVVDRLFTVLYSLCNLLVVKASNLAEICAGDNLANLSKETIEGFIQLRSDYKTLRVQIVRPK